MRSFALASRGWLAAAALLVSLLAGCAQWLPTVGEGWPPGYLSGTIPAEYKGIASPLDLDDPKTIDAGRPIFEAFCAVCHGATGAGNGPDMPYLDFKPPAYADPPVRRALENNLDYVFWWISRGVEQTQMPAFENLLTVSERWQVIAYIRYLSRQPAPTPQAQSRRPPWLPTPTVGQP